MFVGALCPYPAIPGQGLWCVWWGTGFGFAPPIVAGVCGVGSGLHFSPPILAGVLRCLCLCARFACTPPLLTRLCGVAVWVPVLAFNPPFLAGGLGCARLCARSACTLPVLAGVCSVGVCAWVRVSAAPRNTWPGC